MKIKIDIRYVFAVAVLLACMVPLIWHVKSLAVEDEDGISAQARAELDERSAEAAQRLDDWYVLTQGSLKSMAQIPGLMSMESEAGRAELAAYAKAMPWIRVIFSTKPDGMITLRTDDEKMINASERPYFKNALEKGLARAVLVSQVTGASTLYIATRLSIKSEGAGGIVGLGIDLDKMSEVVVGSGEQKNSREQVFVAQEDGKLLAHSRVGAVAQKVKGELTEINQHPMWSKKQSTGQFVVMNYADATGARWIGAMRQSNLGWYVGVEMPAAEFTGGRQAAWVRLVKALGFAAAAALVLGFLAGHWTKKEGNQGTRGAQLLGKAAVAAAFAAAMPVAGFWAYEEVQLKRVDRAEATAMLASTARRSARKMQSWMENNETALSALAWAPKLMERSGRENATDKAWVHERLKLGIAQLPWVRASYVLDSQGKPLAESDDAQRGNVGDRLYFKQARVEQFGHQVAEARSSKKNSLFTARAIKADDGTFMGVAALVIDLDAVSNQVVNDKLGVNGQRFVMDKEGYLVAHSAKDLAQGKNGELLSYADHALWKSRSNGLEPKLAEFERGGKKYLGAVGRAEHFYVGVALPIEEVEARSREALGALSAWVVIALGLGGMLGAAITRQWIQKAARRI